MNKNVSFSSLISILIVLGIIFNGCENESFENVANPSNLNNVTDSIYIFPVTPGMELWSKFETYDEKTKSCQIPDFVLKNLSTEGLIKTCLTYPLLLNFCAYDNLQEGCDELVASFNGFRELVNRKDAAKDLLKYYVSFDPNLIGYENDVSLQSFRLMAIELFLASEKIMIGLNESEKNELIKLCVEKHLKMNQNPEEYGLFSCISQSLLIYRLLENVSPTKLKNADSELEFFIQNGNLPVNQDILLNSYDIAVEYLNTKGFSISVSKLKGAIACTPTSATVKTPKGSSVAVAVYGCEPLSSSNIKALDSQFKAAYPKAIFLSSASAKYNCHSYAWYSQSTSNYRWMNNPSKYWSDGSYTMVNMCAPNLVHTYGSTTHSAIAKAYNSLPLRSKWGQAPLMAHNYFDCPYSGTLRSYKRN